MSNRAVNQSSASERDEAIRQRQLNRRLMARRPRRVQPLVIIAVVMSIGLFFIGITLTIVAYWPGNSSIGKDPLKAVGPALLTIGAFSFFCCLAWIFFMNDRNKQQWAKTISERTASRSTLGGISTISAGVGRQPSIDAKPGRSILKMTPSTSTNRGSDVGDNDSGLANTHASVNGSYDRDTDSSLGSAGLPSGYRIESLPDPGQARRAPRGSANGPIEHSSDTEQGPVVPQPVRQIARPGMDRRTRNRAEEAAQQRAAAAAAAASNSAYADEERIDTRPALAAEGRAIHNYSGEGGFDMYGGQGALGGVPSQGAALPPRQPVAGMPNAGYTENERRVPRQPGPYAPRPQIPRQDPEQHLRINIKAQPGTSVHITPGAQQARPPVAQPMGRTDRAPSVETEI